MKFHGVQIQEGSSISNLTVASGTSFPGSPNEAELFFRTDADVTLRGLHAYVGGNWGRIASADAVTVPTGAALPETANVGDLFYKNSNDLEEALYVYNGTAWASTSSGEASNSQPEDADLTAIAALSGTAGYLKKTAANTWSLDNASYLPSTGGSIVGDIDMTGSIIPSVDNTYSLGSLTHTWKDVFVGPGSLYVNGVEVISEQSDTMVFSTDLNQNLRIETSGTGNLELQASNTGAIIVKGALQITSGKRILDTAGLKVEFGDSIDMTGNNITGLGTPSNGSDATSKTYVDGLTSSDATIVRTTGNQTIAGNKTFTGTTVIQGDLTVSGSVVTVNTETVNIADNILEINSNFTTGTPTEDAGIQVRRGDFGVARFVWDETNDYWTIRDGAASPAPLNFYTGGTVTAASLVGPLTGNASTASALATSRSISATGDASWTVNFTGAANATGALTLADVATSGTFKSVTIDSKGRVTEGTNPTTLAGYGIADAQPLDGDLTSIAGLAGITGLLRKNSANTWALDTEAYLTANQSITLSGDVTGSGTTAITTTLATVNSNVGTFGSASLIPVLTIDGKGRVTAASTVAASGGGSTYSTIFNNQGQVHSTNQDANTVDFGFRHLQSATNSPVPGGGAQWYLNTIGLGSDYTSAQYAHQTAFMRQSAGTVSQYYWYRQREGGTWGAWSKAHSGYADTAGNVSSISNAVGGAYTWTGIQYFDGNKGVNTYLSSQNTYGLEASSGDGGAAAMSFHRRGHYAVNIGLDPDNYFRIGGWSAGTNRLQLNLDNGNLTVAGAIFPNNSASYLAATTGSYGALRLEGTTGNYSGLQLGAAAGTVSGMYDTTGNGGDWDSTTGWHTYWHRGNTCLALGGSSTLSGYRAYTNGAHYVAGKLDVVTNTTGVSTGITAINGDITAYRSGGTSGVIYLNNSGSKYLYYDGTNFSLNGGSLVCSGDITAFSDIRVKKNIELITGALDKVQQIRGVTFERTDGECADGRRYAGVIAQEVEKVLPEVVSETEADANGENSGIKNVAYGNMVGLLIEAIKELNAKVDTLSAKLAKYES